MERIDSQGATIDNRFTDGDVSLGIQATAIWAKWLNDIQEEIALTIEGLGGTVDGSAQNQLLTQLQVYFRNASNLVSGSLPAARFNDTAHGNRGNNDGAAHALVNETFAGFMSPFDFIKLQSLNGVKPGDIIARPTDIVPDGYLHCNGASLGTTAYANLYAAIGYAYGGSGASFLLPDYRGQFLRGWANGSGNDPDRGSRLNRGDGTTGDNVGTRQNSEFETHSHSLLMQYVDGSGRHVAKTNVSGGTTDTMFTGGNGGSSETRPININVMYCIKY